MKHGKLNELTISPISLQFSAHRASKGTPKPAAGQEAEEILSQIQRLSEAFAVSFTQKKEGMELRLT